MFGTLVYHPAAWFAFSRGTAVRLAPPQFSTTSLWIPPFFLRDVMGFYLVPLDVLLSLVLAIF